MSSPTTVTTNPPTSPPKLTHSTLLILGGTSGIGLAVAHAFLSLQTAPTFHLTISGSSPTRLAAALSTLHAAYPAAYAPHITGHACDLAAPDPEPALAELLAFATDEGERRIDHVVFTAGDALPLTPLAELSVGAIHAAAAVRFTAPLLLAKLLPSFITSSPSSSLTLTGGVNAQRPGKGWTVPAAYGAGLEGMARGLAVDMAPVRVNVVAPGAVETGLWDGLPGGVEGRERARKMFAERTTVGEVGRAEDVAEAYVYLMRDRFAAGSVVASNGGALLV